MIFLGTPNLMLNLIFFRDSCLHGDDRIYRVISCLTGNLIAINKLISIVNLNR